MAKRREFGRRTAGPFICPRCNGEVDASGRCTRCEAYLGGPGWEVHVEGTNAAEVQRVAEKLSGHRRQASPWSAGSFYLAATVVMVAVLLTAARMLHPVVLPLVIVGAVVLVSVVGALQLRQDEKLAQKSFLQLMSLALAQLRFVGRRIHESTRPRQRDFDGRQHSAGRL